jgi:hypothetical protein
MDELCELQAWQMPKLTNSSLAAKWFIQSIYSSSHSLLVRKKSCMAVVSFPIRPLFSSLLVARDLVCQRGCLHFHPTQLGMHDKDSRSNWPISNNTSYCCNLSLLDSRCKLWNPCLSLVTAAGDPSLTEFTSRVTSSLLSCLLLLCFLGLRGRRTDE